jgi:hypothetical protein
MMTRPGASLCSVLLVWLAALGAGPLRHPGTQPEAVRSAVEVALRDVADAPLLAPRADAARITSARLAGRDVPATHLAAPPAPRALPLPGIARAARNMLALQDDAHDARPRWRPYDAAAPPAHSRIAR